MTRDTMQGLTLLSALIRLGSAGVRDACDVWEASMAPDPTREPEPQERAVRARQRNRGITDAVVAFVQQGPATFTEIRAHFPNYGANQLSQALNHARMQGRVGKRGRARTTPWRARRSA